MKTPDIQDFKTVFVAWTNTDLTEGRGYQIPYAVSESKATVTRLGLKKSVQGCDCSVTEEIALEIDGKWLAPCRLVSPSKEDNAMDERMLRRAEAIAKAMSGGLTMEDIAALTG